jgi:hypothetical protein
MKFGIVVTILFSLILVNCEDDVVVESESITELSGVNIANSPSSGLANSFIDTVLSFNPERLPFEISQPAKQFSDVTDIFFGMFHTIEAIGLNKTTPKQLVTNLVNNNTYLTINLIHFCRLKRFIHL